MFFLTSPFVIKSGVAEREEIVDIRQKQLEAYIEFPLISDSMNYVFLMESFCDTDYHLSNTGRIIRTQQLIKDIQGYREGDAFDNVKHVCGIIKERRIECRLFWKSVYLRILYKDCPKSKAIVVERFAVEDH